ncbi:MAG TPA: preprotein translocase subunit SecG [Gemmataceae bacterium]|nr:preprotein translocase subunit SecG [Gemmataceae bacterium]
MLLGDVSLLAVWSWVPGVLNTLVILAGLFLILLVLIQRGKGGGLAGAFGGIGGSSAFGSRAGDLFTRITIIAAAVWILLIMLTVKVVQPPVEVKQPSVPPAPSPDQSQLGFPKGTADKS